MFLDETVIEVFAGRGGDGCVSFKRKNNLPFGGINNSGIGKSTGYYGFKEFSNERAILKALHSGSIAMPLWFPYGKLANSITKIMLKFF